MDNNNKFSQITLDNNNNNCSPTTLESMTHLVARFADFQPSCFLDMKDEGIGIVWDRNEDEVIVLIVKEATCKIYTKKENDIVFDVYKDIDDVYDVVRGLVAYDNNKK